jgi:pyridoxamine 5'-phosphate oxidase
MKKRWEPFDIVDCDLDPFVQFRHWFDEALDVMPEREAVTLVTSTTDGRPSARMVLLRHVDDHSFGWFTNYRSRKGRELASNPHASLLWYCEPLGRQIRIEGDVRPMAAEDSDVYFASRPRGHQLGAHASFQSEPIADRQTLEERVAQVEREFEGRDVPRPHYWGGYLLDPVHFEFWQQRSDRLHDRILYSREAARWHRQRHAP